MPVFTDQVGHRIELPAFPRRIISIVPSQTELLFDLGLNDEVIGITKFCVHPAEWFRSKTRVGGTKQLNLQLIHELKPDLIIANKEENTREEVKALQEVYPVWTSDISDLDSALIMINEVGRLVDRQEKSNQLIREIQTGFTQLMPLSTAIPTAYLIWQKPYMAAGGDTFIHDMIQRMGLKNIYKNTARYPETSIAELIKSKVEIVLLSSEPFPFKEKHLTEISEKLPGARVILVDGEMFSWYGSRLLKTAGYLQELIEKIEK